MVLQNDGARKVGNERRTSSDVQPVCAPEKLLCFIQAVFDPHDLVLVRAIETWEEDAKKKSRTIWNATQYLVAKHFANVRWWSSLLQVAEREHANLFFGVCPRFGRKQYDRAFQIRTVRVLWLDIDRCTVEEALRRCQAAALPEPSIVVISGHGVHLYWLLDKAYLIDDVGDPPPIKWKRIQVNGKEKRINYYIDPQSELEVLERDFPSPSPKGRHIEEILSGISKRLCGDHTHDLARLLRLPCTMNRKNERNGIAPVPCTLEHCDPDKRYPLSLFEPFAQPMVCDLYQLVADCATAADRSKADYRLCCYAIRKGIDQEEIWRHVANVGKCSQRGRAYFDLTWRKAEAEIMSQHPCSPAAASAAPVCPTVPHDPEVCGLDSSLCPGCRAEKAPSPLDAEPGDPQRIWQELHRLVPASHRLRSELPEPNDELLQDLLVLLCHRRSRDLLQLALLALLAEGIADITVAVTRELHQ